MQAKWCLLPFTHVDQVRHAIRLPCTRHQACSCVSVHVHLRMLLARHIVGSCWDPVGSYPSADLMIVLQSNPSCCEDTLASGCTLLCICQHEARKLALLQAKRSMPMLRFKRTARGIASRTLVSPNLSPMPQYTQGLVQTQAKSTGSNSTPLLFTLCRDVTPEAGVLLPYSGLSLNLVTALITPVTRTAALHNRLVQWAARPQVCSSRMPWQSVRDCDSAQLACTHAPAVVHKSASCSWPSYWAQVSATSLGCASCLATLSSGAGHGAF